MRILITRTEATAYGYHHSRGRIGNYTYLAKQLAMRYREPSLQPTDLTPQERAKGYRFAFKTAEQD